MGGVRTFATISQTYRFDDEAGALATIAAFILFQTVCSKKG